MDPDVVAPDMLPSFCSLPDGPPFFPVKLSVIIAPAQSRCSFADFSKTGLAVCCRCLI